jgi:hypothetical protein
MKKKTNEPQQKPQQEQKPAEVNLDFFLIRSCIGADFLDIKIGGDRLTVTAGLITPGAPQIIHESRQFSYEELRAIDEPNALIVGKFKFFRDVSFLWKPRKEYK